AVGGGGREEVVAGVGARDVDRERTRNRQRGHDDVSVAGVLGRESDLREVGRRHRLRVVVVVAGRQRGGGDRGRGGGRRARGRGGRRRGGGRDGRRARGGRARRGRAGCRRGGGRQRRALARRIAHPVRAGGPGHLELARGRAAGVGRLAHLAGTGIEHPVPASRALGREGQRLPPGLRQ